MKKYQIIYADPPWRYKRKGKYCAGRYYDTMTVEEICNLPIKAITDHKALLFLWTTNAFLRQAFDVVDAWGFEYKTCITWKKSHYGLGYWAWGQTEHCFLCAKGEHRRIKPPLLSTIFEHNKTSHSVKPNEFRELIEKFPYSPRIELFARPLSPMFPKREGWDVWGNEMENDIELSLPGKAEC